MAKEIDLKIQSGPCVVCGETDYPLSMGGPNICSYCDCGYSLKGRLKEYGDKNNKLRAEVKRLKEEIVQLKTQMQPNEYESLAIEAMDEGQALKEK